MVTMLTGLHIMVQLHNAYIDGLHIMLQLHNAYALQTIDLVWTGKSGP